MVAYVDYIMKTCKCNIQRFFFFSEEKKMKITLEKLYFFLYFCSKHTLWVFGEAVLTSTHNVYFGSKIKKNRYTPVNPGYAI